MERSVLAIRDRPLVTTCLVITALAVAANVYYWRERRLAAAAHVEARDRGQTMLAALSERERIDADLAVLREALAEIERNLAHEQSMEANLGYFYRVEKAARVRLGRVDQLASTPTPAGSAFKAVPVSVQLTGSYRQVLAFFREIETGSRLLRVRDFRLERADEANDGDLYAQLTVEMLARP